MSISAIVLAAGKSSRMGRQKLLLPYGGVTVVRHIVRVLRDALIPDIVIVTGYDEQGVRAALDGEDVRWTHNPAYESGMLGSIQVGVRAAEEASGYLICLGDQPAITPALVKAMAERHAEKPSHIRVPTFDGRRGHPIMVPRRFREDVMSDRYADCGLRGLLTDFQTEVHELAVDEPWVLRDMDYPEDYERELQLRTPG